MSDIKTALLKELDGQDAKADWDASLKSGDEQAMLLAAAKKIPGKVSTAALKSKNLVSRTDKLKKLKEQRVQPKKIKYDHTLLLIDDDASALELLEDILEEAKIGESLLLKAANAKQALSHIKNHAEIDLIISDYELPDANGIQLLNSLNQRGINNFEVIFISGHAQMDIIKTAIKIGAKNWILKPIDPEKVIDSVESLIKARDAA